MLHSVLLRQLRKLGLDAAACPPGLEAWGRLLERVGKTYEQADQDRYLVERALEVSSREMQDLHGNILVSEQRVTAQRDKLHAILNSLGAGVCVLDTEGRVLSMNPEGERLLGWPEGELLGKKFAHVAANGTHALKSALAVSRALRGQDGSFLRRDGGLQPVAYALNPVAEDGERVGAVLVFEDMKACREAEMALRESEHRLRESEAMFRHMAEGIEQVFWVARPRAGPFLYISPAFRHIWGRDPEDVVADPALWIGSVHAEDRERVGRAARKKEDLGGYDETYRIVRPDGAIRWVRDRAYPVPGANGVVSRIYGVAEDITEIREAEEGLQRSEEQLRQSQKMEAIGRLAGGVAHDFNNLLTAILGYGVSLDERLPKDDPGSRMVAQILRAANRASTLTRQLLALSRKQVVQAQPLDLDEVVSDIAPMLRRLIGEDIELQTRASSRSVIVNADPGQIEQVILNLAVNSRDAMPLGGTLRIEAATAELDDAFASAHPDVATGKYAVIAVSDTGTGMDEETRKHLFEPFFTTKEPGKGTGLGLATVYGIAKQYGGHVGVDSEMGRGTTFKIYLPLLLGGQGAAPGVRRDSKRASRGTETVLLVEDEEPVRSLAHELLSGAGYNVLAAASGTEALAMASGYAGEIEGLLTDTVMPGMSGPAVAGQISAARPGIHILFMSGYTDDAIVQHGVLSGEMNFLAKPFMPDELLRRLREALDEGVPRNLSLSRASGSA